MNDQRHVVHGSGPFFLAVLISILVFLAPAPQVSAAPFYQGKMIRLVVGFAPGGGFDMFSRVIARHIGRYLPGKPKVIVQNMPGAGTMVAANRVYATQPGDGLTIVNFHFGMNVQALVGEPNANFDPLKYIWLGHPSLGALPEVLWIRSELPIRSLEDLRKRKEPLNTGATAPSTSAGLAGTFLRFLGLPVKNVYGYRGSAPIMAALEGKELDARVLPQDTMQTTYRRFIEGGQVRPIVALGDEPRLKALEGIATLRDFKLSGPQRQLANFLTTTWALLRVYAIPPGTPPDRVKALRQAYITALKSPGLIKDAKRQGITIAPMSGEEVERIVQNLYKTPPAIIEQYKKFAGWK